MKNSSDYIGSGVLELYVLGETTPEESEEIARLAAVDPVLQAELNEIELALEQYALSNAIDPGPISRAFTLAAIDFADRMQGGEAPSVTPLLNAGSKLSDYSEWLSRKDMILPEDADSLYAKILTYTPELVCAIVWIKEMTPKEVHDDEHERFLIIEGSCDLTVGETVYQLKVGDYFEVPLYETHHVVVTSEVPCKAILQRVAA